eukprot:SAG31_NODE_614_length_13525_cov_4.312230_2_plen_77_part_00
MMVVKLTDMPPASRADAVDHARQGDRRRGDRQHVVVRIRRRAGRARVRALARGQPRQGRARGLGGASRWLRAVLCI